jgi:GNAT superfamily N-acetyltransferase
LLICPIAIVCRDFGVFSERLQDFAARQAQPPFVTPAASVAAWYLTEADMGSFAQVSMPRVSADIAELGPEHEAEFRNLLLGLDKTACSCRFAGRVSDSYLTSHSHQALSAATRIAGAFVEAKLRGVVELYEENCPQDVEAAFVVAEGWRQRGLGSALMHDALNWAQRTGKRRLRVIFSRNNWPMRKLASRVDARFDLVLDEIVADVAVGRAPIGSTPGGL